MGVEQVVATQGQVDLALRVSEVLEGAKLGDVRVALALLSEHVLEEMSLAAGEGADGQDH